MKTSEPDDIRKDAKEINVIIGTITDDDVNLFFGPIRDDDIFVRLPIDTRFPTVMHTFGFFKSKSQARKNGWDKDVPEGFFSQRIGKKKRLLTILKITKGENNA